MDGGTARLTVGELARAAGITAQALRHYDRLGVFRPDGRGRGHRLPLVRGGPGAPGPADRPAPGGRGSAGCSPHDGSPPTATGRLPTGSSSSTGADSRPGSPASAATSTGSRTCGTRHDEPTPAGAPELPPAPPAPDHEPGARRAAAGRRPVQRRLGADGDRGAHRGRRRPHAAHGPRLPAPLGRRSARRPTSPAASGSAPASTPSSGGRSPPCTTPAECWSSAGSTASSTGTSPSPTRRSRGRTPSPATGRPSDEALGARPRGSRGHRRSRGPRAPRRRPDRRSRDPAGSMPG